MNRRVAVIATASTAPDDAATVPEMVFDVTHRAVAASGLGRGDIDLTVSGSSDVRDGRPFAFVFGLEALGAWPPTEESHLEQDGAFAAWYAWLKLLSGAADSALVVAWGRPGEASHHHVTNSQLDPFTLAPLGLDGTVTAALQAEAWLARTGSGTDVLDRGVRTLVPGRDDTDPIATPLMRRHLAPLVDGACAIVLAAEEVARGVDARPAWIAGADLRTEPGALGQRDLARLPSARAAMTTARRRAGWGAATHPDLAELSATAAHQVPMLVEALDLPDTTAIDPSGGAMAGDTPTATGLERLAAAVRQLRGEAGPRQVRGAELALAHAASGHALQQNLVWLLEAER